VVGLLVSDVVGDDPGTIASGPFAPDTTTYADALDALDRFDVDVPDEVREHLEAGARAAGGDSEGPDETPGPGDPAFEHVDTHTLLTSRVAVDAAAGVARERGYAPLVLSTRMRGEARECALAHVACAEEALATGDPVDPPAVVLSGGEVTVTVRGDGEGGPNMEFALAAALDLPAGTALASVDTDGDDGGTDAAGALVDPGTLDGPDEREAARDALADNDAYPFFEARDALLRVESATNVNDLRALAVVDRSDADDGPG